MANKTSNPANTPNSKGKQPSPRSGGAKSGSKPEGFIRRNRLPIILFFLCFVVYGNSIYNGYALDDEFYTAGANKLTQKGIKGIPEIFNSRTFFNNDGSGYSYRPVAVTSFALEIQFFGERPHVSHFINVLLYALTIVLLFGLLRYWFKAQGDWFAFFATLMFLVHPIHTEVVANIKCRDEILSFMFSVIALRILFIRTVGEGKKWALIPAGLVFGLAILSKSSCIPVYAMMPIMLWYFGNVNWKKGVLYMLPLILIGIFVKGVLIHRLPEMSRTLLGFENPLKGLGFSSLSATAVYVLGRFVWLHFIPHPLIYYYGLNEIPISSWSDPVVIISLVVLLGIGTLTIIELRKKSIAGFGLAWCVANLMMFSNLFGFTPGIFAERFAYAASLGFVIAVTDYVFRFTKISAPEFKWNAPAFSRAKWIFVVVAVVFSVRCVVRNEAWEDKETLYRNDVELAPESAKVNMLLASYLSSKAAEMNFDANRYFNGAKQYAAAGRMNEARMLQDSGRIVRQNAYALFRESRTYYLQALDAFPDYYTAWSNLGTSYYFTGEYRDGIPFFKKAIAIKPDYAEAYFNLGMSYEQLGTTDTIIDNRSSRIVSNQMLLDSSFYYFREGLEADSSYVNTADQLSRILILYKHDSLGALAVLKKAAIDNPKSDVPWNAMSGIYFQQKDTASGVAALETAVKLNPDNFNRAGNLANYFFRKGDVEKANYYKAIYDEKFAAYQKKLKLLGKK